MGLFAESRAEQAIGTLTDAGFGMDDTDLEGSDLDIRWGIVYPRNSSRQVELFTLDTLPADYKERTDAYLKASWPCYLSPQQTINLINAIFNPVNGRLHTRIQDGEIDFRAKDYHEPQKKALPFTQPNNRQPITFRGVWFDGIQAVSCKTNLVSIVFELPPHSDQPGLTVGLLSEEGRPLVTWLFGKTSPYALESANRRPFSDLIGDQISRRVRNLPRL